MIRRPPRSTLDRSSAASDVYKRQPLGYQGTTVVGLGELQVNLANASNILPTVADLRLAGGTLTLIGGAGGTSAQTVSGGLTIGGGDIKVNASAGATALNLPSVWSRTTGGS